MARRENRSESPIEICEIQGPPNDPELALPVKERAGRRRARWAFSQLRWQFRESRTAAAIGYQAAKGGWLEARAVSNEARAAQHLLVRLDNDADPIERLNLEIVAEGWHHYTQMHVALAENGAATVVTTIDRIFKQFAERASLGEQAIKGGPEAGRLQTTLLELVRAGGNWSRHRHEWHAKNFRWDENHSNWSVRILSRCDVCHLDDNVFTQIVDRMPWSSWIEAEEHLVTLGYNLGSFAFASPYKLHADDKGYWNPEDR